MAVLALTLACGPRAEPSVPVEAAAAGAAGEFPEHIRAITEPWSEVVARHTRAAFAEHRVDLREVRWTDAERAELEALRTEARATITNANVEDRPWLLVAYASIFSIYGIGTEWADRLLDIPVRHPVWAGSGASGSRRALGEASDPRRFRRYVHAVAAVNDAPSIQAVSAYLHLEEADRAGDWARARQFHDRLESIQLPTGDSTVRATVWLDVADQLDPDRVLRADTQVPNWCAPAILGPHAGDRVCLDQQFPHDRPTLIVGWATWCSPCNEQLPRVIERVRGRSLRVIAISHDDDAELARTHLRDHGVDDWTVLLPRADRPEPRDGASLDLRPIPFLALVDGEGKVEAGPPWLDAESLAAHLR